jgi:hypothetical protein
VTGESYGGIYAPFLSY